MNINPLNSLDNLVTVLWMSKLRYREVKGIIPGLITVGGRAGLGMIQTNSRIGDLNSVPAS